MTHLGEIEMDYEKVTENEIEEVLAKTPDLARAAVRKLNQKTLKLSDPIVEHSNVALFNLLFSLLINFI